MAFIFLLFSISHAFADDPGHILAASIKGNPVHKQVIETFIESFKEMQPGSRVHTLEIDPENTGHLKDRIPSGTRLIVTAGSQTLQNVVNANTGIPVYAALIPRLSFEHIRDTQGSSKAPVNALYLDQPFTRQLALARMFFRKSPRILAILGPNSSSHHENLTTSARKLGIPVQISSLKDDKELDLSFHNLLSDTDALLAIADPSIYNQHNIQFIFLSTYRRSIPVIGFSEGFVKAGALAAVYTTPDQIGRQMSEILSDWIQKHPESILPDSRYPDDFSISTNHRVARSLGISLPSENSILEILKKDIHE